MPLLAQWNVKPPRRCYGQRRNLGGFPCGKLAAWMRVPTNGGECAFFCDRCHQPGDVPIADDAPFRRVSVAIVVYLGATSLVDRIARQEAIAQLERAVQELGGVLDVRDVQSGVGRGASQAAPGAREAEREGV